ncbi:MAG: nucleoside deaminase [Candidatus Omnitrophota bacterium]
MKITKLKDEKFMRLAINKARQGIKKGQSPFGACIVKNGAVLSLSHNVVWKSADITAHAEINAIRQACKKLKNIDLSGCVVYSTCEPCPMCFSACHWAGISRIVFGTGIKDAKKYGFNELEIASSRMKNMGKCAVRIKAGVLRKESLQLFRLWAGIPGSRAY